MAFVATSRQSANALELKTRVEAKPSTSFFMTTSLVADWSVLGLQLRM
jgi:hypothetical protein